MPENKKKYPPNWRYLYRMLLETVERFTRQNRVLAAKIEELHASAGVPSRLVEIDASALRDERHYPSPGGKVDQALNAPWWPQRLPAPEPLYPNPGWTSYSLKDQECAVIGCSVAGLQRDALAKVVAGIERQQQRRRKYIPLFLTDSTDFDIFRSRGYVFEYFPGPEKWIACEGTEPWPTYASRRFEFIKRKWNLTGIVQFGPEAFPRVGHRSAKIPDRHRIIYFPDYSAGNPYQILIYQNLGREFDAISGNIDAALMELVNAASRYMTIFHLHWEEQVYMDAPDDATAARQCHDFVTKLEKFIAGDGVFVWTIHNLHPHEQRYTNIHQDFCRNLSRLVHRVHVHSRMAIPMLEASYELGGSKIHIIPHGNYCGVYDSGSTPGRVREQLGVGPDERLFLFFGKIRAYKGVQILLQAFDELNHPSAKVIVAGRQYVPILLDGLTDEAISRIIIMNRDIPDQEVGMLFSAADFVVLPFKAILASGSLLLALSLGRPLIVPDFETVREIIVDGVNGYLFNKDDGYDALAEALRRAMSADSATLERMKRYALITAMRFDLATVGKQMSLLFRRAGANARHRRANGLAALSQVGPEEVRWSSKSGQGVKPNLD